MPQTIKPGLVSRIRRRLLQWYDAHKRDMPWRNTGDPYRIWLSEMMLQQTQVATVQPYFERFVSRFPGVADLAAADLDEVLRLWSGLGYYARARNMHKAAKAIVSDFGGRFPDSPETLRQLPGVGRYSAAAIASVAFGRRAAVVDGNVIRVVSRLFDFDGDTKGTKGQARIWEFAEALMPSRRCGDHNQAMMELGATICSPGESAQCSICPLRNECEAAARGTVSSRPVKAGKAAVKNETHAVAAIERGGKWLFVRRPERGLWGGLWELPTTVVNRQSARAAVRRLVAAMFDETYDVEDVPFCDVKHQLTHRSVRFVGYACGWGGPSRRRAPTPLTHAKAAVQWIDLDDAASLGIATAMKKVVASLRNHT